MEQRLEGSTPQRTMPFSLMLEVHSTEIERIIERTKDPLDRRAFLSTKKWTTRPERPNLENCTSDSSEILHIFECLGIGPDAKISEINNAFKTARVLLDPGLLAKATSSQAFLEEAAKAYQRIELAYRLLASFEIREHFVNVLLENAGQTGPALYSPSKETGRGGKLQLRRAKDARSPKVEGPALTKKQKAKQARPKILAEAEGDDSQSSPKKGSIWRRLGRVALITTLIGGFTFGYKKNRDKIDPLITETPAVAKMLAWAGQAKDWWSASAVKRELDTQGAEAVKVIKERTKEWNSPLR
jgi:hypothetical protein